MNTQINCVWVSRIAELLRLKSELTGRHITPEELGRYVGVSRQTIYNWMADDGVPTIAADKSARVAEYFDVPVWRVWRLAEKPIAAPEPATVDA